MRRKGKLQATKPTGGRTGKANDKDKSGLSRGDNAPQQQGHCARPNAHTNATTYGNDGRPSPLHLPPHAKASLRHVATGKDYRDCATTAT